jgi:hypothetical protein
VLSNGASLVRSGSIVCVRAERTPMLNIGVVCVYIYMMSNHCDSAHRVAVGRADLF